MIKIEVNQEELQILLNQKLQVAEIAQKLNVKTSLIRRKMFNWGLKSQYEYKHSPESKAKLSISRKNFLKNNPDKHPWKSKDKFKSKPCENLKSIISELNVSFVSEYQPSNDRFFSIDIAFPDKMIGIEVNGNQHYNRDGSLKEYYMGRTLFLENLGWKIYQFHYSCCFNIEILTPIIFSIVDSEKRIDFDYLRYEPKTSKAINTFCGCGLKKSHVSIECRKCSFRNPLTSIRKRKIKIRPTRDVLHNMIWSAPLTGWGLFYNIEANTIKKWIIRYKLITAPRGYWQKLKNGRIIDYQI